MEWEYRTFKFNENEKNKLIEKQSGSNSIAFAFSRLNAIDKYETEINKSILEWNREDFNNHLRSIDYVNESSLLTVKTFIEKYVEYLVFEFNKGEEALEVIRDMTVVDIRELINNERRNEELFTIYDYQSIINDTISEEKLSPIEKTIFIFLWNNIVKVSNDLFDFEKQNIDFEKNTVINYKGEVVELSPAEMQPIKDLKETQEKMVNISLGVRYNNQIMEVGTIPVREKPNAYGLFVQPCSNKLIHTCIGSWFSQSGRGVYAKQMRQKPFMLKFGTAAVKKITDSIEAKTGIATRPIAIQRHAKYYQIIKTYDLNSSNISNYSANRIKLMLNNEVSCQYDELVNIIKKMEKQAENK